MFSKDLDGIIVVSVEQAVAAPYCSARLADAGARVLKIERPEGDFARNYDRLVHGESAYFVWLNRGKESVCLNLQEASARELLHEMVMRADVFMQNLAPGAIERLGFSHETLRAENPRLITVWISGYGDEGPYRLLKAYDLLVQAESGLSSITGTPEGMARTGVSVCDISAGMTAHQAVLQALFARTRSGNGRHIAVSLFHALADWMNVPYLQFAYGGKVPVRSGLSHPTIAPYSAYADRDGQEVLFSVQHEREWLNFCIKVLCRPDIATDPRFIDNTSRVQNRQALDALINEVFAKASRDELAQRLGLAEIAYGRVATMADLTEHPQNRYVEVQTPTGPVKMLDRGDLIDATPLEFGPVPALGQHTDAVVAEFGQHS